MADVNEPLGRPLLRGGGDVRVDLGKYGTVQGFATACLSAFDFHLSATWRLVEHETLRRAVDNGAEPLRCPRCAQ